MEKHSHLQLEDKTKSKLKNEMSTQYYGENWNFKEAFDQQLKSFEKVLSGNTNLYILSGIHKAVFTLGNSLKETSPKGQFVQTDRGGRMMYHGPGQLTIYPIFKLDQFFKGPRLYTKFLFDLCIKYFKKEHDLDLVCRGNGLWTKEGKKVGFVGLRIKEGICYHGISLNYRADLKPFLEHSPCDISGDQAGNLFLCSDSSPSLEAEAVKLMDELKAGLTIQRASLV